MTIWVIANDQIEQSEEARESHDSDYKKNPDYVSEWVQKIPRRVVCVVPFEHNFNTTVFKYKKFILLKASSVIKI